MISSMLDLDVREALRTRLSKLHAAEASTTRFVDELGVAGQVRIDMAVLNGDFAGYEIKSGRDTLRRLPKQVEVYSKVLDYATLVVAENHLDEARDMLPIWWGVTVALPSRSGVRLKRARQARRNRSLDAVYLSRLLWRDEALECLARNDNDRGMRSAPLFELHSHLAESISIRTLRDEVRLTLKSRRGWKVNQPQAI